MRPRALAPSLRHAIVPLLSLIIFCSLAGCGGSGSGSAPDIGGAKVDPDVEAQNRAAIDAYNKEKGKAK